MANFRKMIAPTALAAAAMFAQSASAVEWGGYFRAGVGSNSEGGDQVCFAPPVGSAIPGIDNFTFRLGNECSNYTEWLLSQTVYEGEGGAFFKVGLMVNYYPNGDHIYEESTVGFRQQYVEAGNLFGGFLQGATFWAGKKFAGRHDVHINDFYYWDNSGPGAGVENISIGSAKLAYFYRRDNRGSAAESLSGHDFRLDIPVNPKGTLNLGFEAKLADENDTGLEGGYTFTVQHTQGDFFGGYNKLAFQYGTGAVSNLRQTFPRFDADEDDSGWRIVEGVQVQLSDMLSGMATFVWQHHESDVAGTPEGDWMAFGVRPVVHFSDYFNVAFELGYNQVEPEGGDTAKLTKFTVAPQISAGRGFWARPVLRAFLTYASWDNDAGNAGTGGVFGTDESGLTYGVQTEVWW